MTLKFKSVMYEILGLYRQKRQENSFDLVQADQFCAKIK